MAETSLFRTTITAVGPEAAELIAGGLLILFDASAPPELAEVSVLHEQDIPPGRAPIRGDSLHIGAESFGITAVGDGAWHKVGDIGHLVFNFNGAGVPERPGEMCVQPAPLDRVLAALVRGAVVEIRGLDG